MVPLHSRNIRSAMAASSRVKPVLRAAITASISTQTTEE